MPQKLSFLLDTNVVSALQAGHCPDALHALLDRVEPDQIALTGTVVCELQYGVCCLANQKHAPRHTILKAQRLQESLDHLGRLPLTMISEGYEASRLRGTMAACPALRQFYLPKKGCNLIYPAEDITLAAIAIVEEGVIVTANGDDFALINKHFPLRGVYNPFHDVWPVPYAPERGWDCPDLHRNPKVRLEANWPLLVRPDVAAFRLAGSANRTSNPGGRSDPPTIH